jgi:hypothetical protein
MSMELKANLEKFKECSLNIIDMVEKEDYDELESKFSKRQHILDTINKMNYSKEELAKLVEELEIMAISQKISNIIKLKKDILKIQIEDSAIKKNANSNYNKSLINNFHIFSKKI